jgi:hypothetical protein
MNLIIPAAGASTRFPNVKPKWLLTHPNGNLMVAEAIRGLNLDSFERIHLTILAEHAEKFKILDGIRKQFAQLGLAEKLNIIQLDKPTKSQPETVARAIELGKINGPICIKDSDNFFRLEVTPRNFVSVVDLNHVGFVNPGNKSYVAVNENNLVTNIAEKQVISHFFCCGAYGFESAEEYLKYFHELSHMDNLYISHLIFQMILENKAFSSQVCTEYSDWGTLKDWNRYKAHFGTLFIDLDGTLVRNSGGYFDPVWGSTEAIKENVDIVNRLYRSGKVQVIITTSRREEARETTVEQLRREGIEYHQIVFGMNHGKRIVINDYAPTNPFKSCDALNIARNSNELTEMLEAVLHIDG